MILLAEMIAFISLPITALAQVSSVTRPTVQGGGASLSYFGVVTNRPAPSTNLVWVTREKTEAEKAEMVRKTIEFQKKRAEEGSATAQYDLGVRFLNGDGVKKDRELAMKWLRKAADQDHTQAAKKLVDLQKGSSPP
ncbi:MAG: SEL1-like repeat protein [Opitutaceae bacterium]|nr:SEL1-like repeat protein [Verrucomicrobiales bacterium]